MTKTLNLSCLPQPLSFQIERISQFGLTRRERGRKLHATCSVGHASHYFSGSTFLNYVVYGDGDHQSRAQIMTAKILKSLKKGRIPRVDQKQKVTDFTSMYKSEVTLVAHTYFFTTNWTELSRLLGVSLSIQKGSPSSSVARRQLLLVPQF